MARYQVILAYDGSGYLGFQRIGRASRGAGRAVQDVVETALKQIGWQGKTILAAGRTDAGVHASGQVIAFDLAWSHPLEALQRALNAALPSDVSVRQVQVAAPAFHPRYDAIARRYAYRLFCQPARNPLQERYAWRVWPPVDLQRMQAAAVYLPGRYDFAAFGASPRPGGSTIRSVFRADWEIQHFPPFGEAVMVFNIAADAFLYHMVRRLVYLQVCVGQGRCEPELVLQALQRQDGRTLSPAPFRGLAPPNGLELAAVSYLAKDPVQAGAAPAEVSEKKTEEQTAVSAADDKNGEDDRAKELLP